MTGRLAGEEGLMREWGKRRRERGNIIREIEGGGKRPRVAQDMNHADYKFATRKVAEAQR